MDVKIKPLQIQRIKELKTCFNHTYLQSNGIKSEIPRVSYWIVQGILDSFQLRRIFLQKLAIFP